jgi:hypothetical protein
MGRPKKEKTDTVLQKNPLSLALGIYLSLERQKIQPDNKSKDVAKALGIGESLYRMIESGNARVHPKNAIKLIQVFNGSYIQLDSFCKLLIAIQFLDSFTGTKEFVQATNDLKTADPKFKMLLDSLKPAMDLLTDSKSDNDLRSVFLKSEAIANIGSFLSNHEEYGKRAQLVQTDKITGIFQKIPTIYYDFIDKTIQNLLTLPLAFRANDLWKWENNNQSNFRNLYAVIKDKNSIISDENFSRYQYLFLWSDFQEAHFVFIGNHDKTQLKKEFSDKLKKAISDPKLLKDFEDKMEKVKIHTASLTAEEKKKFFIDFDSFNPEQTTEYDMAWVFMLKTNVNVGLKAKVSKSNWKLQEGISLTWEKTDSVLNQIMQHCDNRS